MLNDRLARGRNAMLHLFLTPSPPPRRRRSFRHFPPNVPVASHNYRAGEKFKQSVVLHSRPGTPVLSLPARSSKTIHVSRAVFQKVEDLCRGADVPAATGNLFRPEPPSPPGRDRLTTLAPAARDRA